MFLRHIYESLFLRTPQTPEAIARESFRRRLEAIDWASWSTAYGPAVYVPVYLKRLRDARTVDASRDAAHDLWCGLCHQHAYVSSTAAPAFPFLVEILNCADEAATIEILDIFAGFAWCTRPEYPESVNEWAIQLRQELDKELPRIRGLASHRNEETAVLAESILEAYGEVCSIRSQVEFAAVNPRPK